MNIKRMGKWLLGIVAVSLAYVAIAEVSDHFAMEKRLEGQIDALTILAEHVDAYGLDVETEIPSTEVLVANLSERYEEWSVVENFAMVFLMLTIAAVLMKVCTASSEAHIKEMATGLFMGLCAAVLMARLLMLLITGLCGSPYSNARTELTRLMKLSPDAPVLSEASYKDVRATILEAGSFNVDDYILMSLMEEKDCQ